MGLFFNNIHIRKSEQYSINELKAFLIGQMTEMGFRLSENAEAGDLQVSIYEPEHSGWVSVSSDTFLFNTAEDVAKVLAPVSDKFGTDVLGAACEDSDYLLLNLMNTADGTDGWINVGKRPGMGLPRRTNLASWKKKVSNYEAFSAIMKEQHVFAEEAFYGIADLLDMDGTQVALEPDARYIEDKESVSQLFFMAPEGTEKKLPELRIGMSNGNPCRMNEKNCIFVNNQGGRSKGIAIMIYGDYVENDDLTFDHVTFESDYGSDKRKIVPITLEKVQCEDGKMALYWEDENFNIPPAVSQDIPIMKRMDMEFKRQFGVRFAVHGNPRKILDVKVFIIPLENRQKGSACWYVYMYDGSKEEYIREYNSRCWDKDQMLNPEDYDL